MNGIPPVVWIAGGASVVVIVTIYAIFVLQQRRVDLTRARPSGQKPEWMKITPQSEIVAATQADGGGIGFYDHDPGEGLAAAFVEQIEDIVHARLSEDPALAKIAVDFKTVPAGIWRSG
jgi:hypothetical protein